jgi:hypothetical protein
MTLLYLSVRVTVQLGWLTMMPLQRLRVMALLCNSEVSLPPGNADMSNFQQIQTSATDSRNSNANPVF